MSRDRRVKSEKRCNDGSQCDSWSTVTYNCNEYIREVSSEHGVKEQPFFFSRGNGRRDDT